MKNIPILQNMNIQALLFMKKELKGMRK